MNSISSRLRFLYSLSKGIRRGDLFPSSGRLPSGTAPNGSTRPPQQRGNQVTGFIETTHHVHVKGLSHPLSVLHLTDIHVRDRGPWLTALCEALRTTIPPDLLVLTGDVVTTGWTQEAVRDLLQALPQPKLGAFAVMGNWEHWSGADIPSWRSILAEYSITLLVNEAHHAGPVQLFGTDDHLAGTAPGTHATRALSPDVPVIGLTHSPAFAPALAGPNVPLILSGHSHGGQVRLPLLGAAWVPMGTGSYVAGWYELGGTHLFVSQGLGWSIAPLRFRCAPELARIVLTPA